MVEIFSKTQALDQINFPKIPSDCNIHAYWVEVSTFLRPLRISNYSKVFNRLVANFDEYMGKNRQTTSTIQDFIDFYAKNSDYEKVKGIGKESLKNAENLIKKIKENLI